MSQQSISGTLGRKQCDILQQYYKSQCSRNTLQTTPKNAILWDTYRDFEKRIIDSLI